MTLTEQFIKDAIRIDSEAGIEYFSEEIGGGCCSCRVPYVQFTLMPTQCLHELSYYTQPKSNTTNMDCRKKR